MKRLTKKALDVSNIIFNWIGQPKIWEDAGPDNYEAGSSTWTACQEGEVSLDSILNIPGGNGEIRQWRTTPNGKKKFGNYYEEDWYAFLEDIKTNGITEELMIWVEKNGEIVLAEGNHRREAAKQLGLSSVPVEIRYFGNSQKQADCFNK